MNAMTTPTRRRTGTRSAIQESLSSDLSSRPVTEPLSSSRYHSGPQVNGGATNHHGVANKTKADAMSFVYHRVGSRGRHNTQTRIHTEEERVDPPVRDAVEVRLVWQNYGAHREPDDDEDAASVIHLRRVEASPQRS